MVGVGFGEKLTDKAVKHIKCRFVDCEDAVTLSTERERERERVAKMLCLEMNLFVTLVIFL